MRPGTQTFVSDSAFAFVRVSPHATCCRLGLVPDSVLSYVCVSCGARQYCLHTTAASSRPPLSFSLSFSPKRSTLFVIFLSFGVCLPNQSAVSFGLLPCGVPHVALFCYLVLRSSALCVSCDGGPGRKRADDFRRVR